MRDSPPERDWWLATDDKWYPPELHPDYGKRISTADMGLDSASFESDVLDADYVESIHDEYVDDDREDFEVELIEEEHQFDAELDETSDGEDDRGVAETELIDHAAKGVEEIDEAEELEELKEIVTPPDGDAVDSGEEPVVEATHPEDPVAVGGFVDELLALSERRVAGEISDDEFAAAQTRLIQKS